MLKYVFMGLFFCLPAMAYGADSPLGEWRVKDGTAHIRITAQENVLSGAISWAKDPGTDEHNPDPSLRGRPILGMPVLLSMQPDKDSSRWEGKIYNAENGKIYSADIYLKSQNVLRVEGCLLEQLLCGGEDWTRVH